MKGKCYYCGKEIAKVSVTKHLKSCVKKEEYQKNREIEGKIIKNLFILQINYKYKPNDYWMYISVDENATLKEIDQFLRDVWVECCGHLSKFRINGVDYDVDKRSANKFDFFFRKNSESMDMKLKKVLKEGLTFSYEYDFGDTTYINIKVLYKYNAYQNKDIEIMARNIPIEYKCDKCQNKAQYYCYECGHFYCEKCIENFKCNCDEEMISEMIEGENSPRSGVCGYVYNNNGEDKYLPNI